MFFVFEIGTIQIVFKYVKSLKLTVDLYDLRLIKTPDIWKSIKQG